MGSALDRAMKSSYTRLSVITMYLSTTVWQQFWMQSCCLQPVTHVRRITVLHLNVCCNVWYSSATTACMGL